LTRSEDNVRRCEQAVGVLHNILPKVKELIDIDIESSPGGILLMMEI